MSATKALRAPSKIASALDWKKASGAILALDVGVDRIGLAVASHPAYGDAPQPLDAVKIQLETKTVKNSKKRVLSQTVVSQLQDVVKVYNVRSFVVSWPVQKEGRCGAPCGKVLHTLDSLVESSNIMSDNRPFCLWDEHHTSAPNEDSFGRNPLYGEPCSDASKTIHKASEEQYSHHDCSSKVAAQVMEDFIQSQWPEIYQQQQEQKQPMASSYNQPEISIEWLDHYEDTDAYISVAV